MLKVLITQFCEIEVLSFYPHKLSILGMCEGSYVRYGKFIPHNFSYYDNLPFPGWNVCKYFNGDK